MLKRVHVSNIKVVKNRPLDSRWRDDDYPTSFVPFYLYGNEGRLFVEHVLVKAPNAQMSAKIKLEVSPPLTQSDLAEGLLLYIVRSEKAMQPADGMSTKWFAPGTKYKVNIFKDSNAVNAHGPGLAPKDTPSPIASGTVTIASSAFVDFDRLNKQEFTGRPTHRVLDFTSSAAHPQTKEEWRDVIQTYMRA